MDLRSGRGQSSYLHSHNSVQLVIFNCILLYFFYRQSQFEVESKKHEEQIRHNTVVMMEMQDTINELQRELGNLGRSASRIRQSSDLTTPQVGRT